MPAAPLAARPLPAALLGCGEGQGVQGAAMHAAGVCSPAAAGVGIEGSVTPARAPACLPACTAGRGQRVPGRDQPDVEPHV